MNITIMRAFIALRKMVVGNTSLQLEIADIKKKVDQHDKNIEQVFIYLDELMSKPALTPARKRIGYKPEKEGKS